jgi:hypothetical protein
LILTRLGLYITVDEVARFTGAKTLVVSSWGAAEQAKLFIGKKEVTYEVTI